MICPYCGKNDDKVIDSRASDGGKTIRRRRQCLACKKRFTTYERVEQTSRLMVIKRDGSRVPFNRDNVLKGITAACGKRPIPEKAKERLADEVEEIIHQEFDREVPSRIIGDRVAAGLRDLDEIAYIRFASEYHQVRDVSDLRREIDSLRERPRDVKDQQKLFELKTNQGEGEPERGSAPADPAASKGKPVRKRAPATK
ncbi:MAG: transcriptional regulator NrdR [Planctomycetota bacterium]|nr:transcriptional regulator NrdR [Planctomycetota bacterium]